MIIDSHAHLEPRMLEVDRVLDKMDGMGVDRVALIPAMNDVLPHTPDRLLAMLRVLMKHRVSRPLTELVHRALLTPEGNIELEGEVYEIYSRPDNQPLADALQAHPDRFLGWIFLNPRNNPKVLDELERWRAVPGMIGVKLHPHWHDYRTEILGPLLTRCEELRLPVLIHLGFRRRGDFRALARSYPRLTIIAAHAGFPFYSDLWAYKNDYENLHVDLSSPYIDEALARGAVAAMGPERCLYGTDAPYGFNEPDGSYDYREIRGWIDRMPLSGRERDLILGQNLERLLSLAGRPIS